jgi:probable blue pigment (indigoidine) exporter
MDTSSAQSVIRTWPATLERAPTIGNARMTTAATSLAPVAWGTTYITITELLPGDRPIFIAAMRVLPAGVILLVLGRLRSRWRPSGAEWWRTAMLAAANFGIFFPLLIVSITRLPGGVAAAGGGLQPLFVVLLAWGARHRRPRRLDLIVGGAAAIGVSLIVLQGEARFDGLGVAAVVGANASFAVGIVLTKSFPSPPNQLAATGWQLVISGATLVALTVPLEGVPPVPDTRGLIGFTYLTIVATAVAFVLWFDGIRRLPTPTPPLLGLAAPATGATLGWLVLGESLSASQMLGFLLVGGAITHGALLGGEATPRLGRS